MNTQIKIIIAAAAALILGTAIVSMISDAKIRSMERAVNAAKQQAKASEESAAAAEMQAAEYKQKTEYLETQIAEIGSIARRQDEELEKVSGDVGNARRDVERARKLRAIDANADELCRKLEELGYPCQ